MNARRKAVLQESGIRATVPAATASRASVPRETEIRLSGIRQTDPKETESRTNVLRVTVSRAEETREMAAARTDPPGRAVIRESAARAVIPKGMQTAVTAAAVITGAAAHTAADRTEDSSSQEGAAGRMADLRETDRVDFREAAGRVLWVLQVTAEVRALEIGRASCRERV